MKKRTAWRKILFRAGTAAILSALLLNFAGCNPIDRDYGVSSETSASSQEETPLAIPKIKSSDTVMPIYFDISQFDEENYSSVYLGKKYEFNITYAGSELTVPTSYKELKRKGWDFVETSDYDVNSLIMAGEQVDLQFVNEYNTQITASFYNPSNSSVKVSKCSIAKLNVRENSLNVPDSVYGQFWVNGVTNQSAVTDVVEFLGTPSHFYAVSEGEYYLDYFISKDDRRNGITVYISTENDCVNSIEIASYK